MSPRILLLNGPPRCGKDTAASLLSATPGVQVFKFASWLKLATHRLFDVQGDVAAFESCKEEPARCFFGKTPREVYIAVSETFIKPLFGQRFFGERLAEQIAEEQPRVAVVSDSGFREEARVLVERFGAANVTLVRLHRRGCTFEGDSRSYLRDLFDVLEVDVDNNGSLLDLCDKLRGFVQ